MLKNRNWQVYKQIRSPKGILEDRSFKVFRNLRSKVRWISKMILSRKKNTKIVIQFPHQKKIVILQIKEGIIPLWQHLHKGSLILRACPRIDCSLMRKNWRLKRNGKLMRLNGKTSDSSKNYIRYNHQTPKSQRLKKQEFILVRGRLPIWRLSSFMISIRGLQYKEKYLTDSFKWTKLCSKLSPKYWIKTT